MRNDCLGDQAFGTKFVNTSNFNDALDICKSNCGRECNNILIRSVLEGGYNCYSYKNVLDMFSPHLLDSNYGTSYYKVDTRLSCKLKGSCCGVITSKGKKLLQKVRIMYEYNEYNLIIKNKFSRKN